MGDATNRATACWGAPAPDWIMALAAECDRLRSQAAAGERIGVSGSTVNQILGARYNGDMDRIETVVRGALMSEKIECPVAGEIGRDRCLAEQTRLLDGANPLRAKLYRACRGGCPHSRLKGAPHA